MKTQVCTFDTSVIKTYHKYGDETKAALKELFPRIDFSKPVAITDRIKTWDDVVDELGTDPTKALPSNADKDLVAYVKIRAIAEVLNEGWTPQFTVNERRYFPWFVLYTKDEIDRMSDDERSRVVLRSSCSAYAYGGVACALASYGSSYASTYYGSRLAFKSRDLAIYAGETFAKEYADFVFPERQNPLGFKYEVPTNEDE